MPLLLTLLTAAGLLSCPKACIRLEPFPAHAARTLSILVLGTHISPCFDQYSGAVYESSSDNWETFRWVLQKLREGRRKNGQGGQIFGGGWVSNSSAVTSMRWACRCAHCRARRAARARMPPAAWRRKGVANGMRAFTASRLPRCRPALPPTCRAAGARPAAGRGRWRCAPAGVARPW